MRTILGAALFLATTNCGGGGDRVGKNGDGVELDARIYDDLQACWRPTALRLDADPWLIYLDRCHDDAVWRFRDGEGRCVELPQSCGADELEAIAAAAGIVGRADECDALPDTACDA